MDEEQKKFILRFYAYYKTAVEIVLKTGCRRRFDAEDHVSQALSNIAFKIMNGELTEEKFELEDKHIEEVKIKEYLYMAAKNTFYNACKRGKKSESLTDVVFDQWSRQQTMDDGLLIAFEQTYANPDIFWNAIEEELSAHEFRIVHMHFKEGLDQQETAQVSKISVKTVEAHRYNAKQKLRGSGIYKEFCEFDFSHN